MADVQLSTRSASVKTAYEANPNTNAYTDTEQAKLAGLSNPGVVPQAEAEAGVSTTIWAWTSQRVRQAVRALMNASEYVFHNPAATTSNSKLTDLKFRGLDAAGNPFDFVRIKTEIADTSVNGRRGRFFVMMPLLDSGGAEVEIFKLGPDTDAKLLSTKSGSSSSPSFILQRDNPSPNANDQGPQWIFRNWNAALVPIDFGIVKTKTVVVAADAETGQFEFALMKDGVFRDRVGIVTAGGYVTPETSITDPASPYTWNIGIVPVLRIAALTHALTVNVTGGTNGQTATLTVPDGQAITLGTGFTVGTTWTPAAVTTLEFRQVNGASALPGVAA